MLAETTNVWRSLHHPEKHRDNPVLRPEKPWEGYLVMQPGSTLFDADEGCFKVWYNTQPSRDKPNAGRNLCYAISTDGINWDRPELHLIDHGGSTANNIVLHGVDWTHSVLRDEDDSKRRYKLLYWAKPGGGQHGIYAAFSRDGIRWNLAQDDPVVPNWLTGDTFSVMRDPESGQYWLYHKTPRQPIRTVSRMVSDDFVHWRQSRRVLAPDQYDPPDTEFYGLSAFPYASQYLGLLWVYHTYRQTTDVQLVSSRDGLRWDRTADRKLLMHLIPTNNYQGRSFDSMMVYPASSPILRDGQLWLYYSGFTVPHNAPTLDHDGCIGLATLRQDGFCSFDATEPGHILTRPFIWNGSRLSINARTFDPADDLGRESSPLKKPSDLDGFSPGTIRVGMEDDQGRSIGRYTVDKCTPFRGDESDAFLNWSGRNDLSDLNGRIVQLRFELTNARLYSWRARPPLTYC